MFAKKEDIVFAIVIIAVVFFILAGFAILFLYSYFNSRANKEKEIQRAIYLSQEAERTLIAEELHDDIGGKLSALKLQNEMIRRVNTPDKIIHYVNENATSINKIVKDVRAIVRNQASQYIVDNGILNELHELKKQYSAAYDVQILLVFNFDKNEFKKDFEVNLFRILQEMIHNSVKHAMCSEVKIELKLMKEYLEVFYSDNGKGFEKPSDHKSEGMGLKNIDTRIKLFNGKCDFRSEPGKETSYTINFKLKNQGNKIS
jgi:signal transduction histidine kinase